MEYIIIDLIMYDVGLLLEIIKKYFHILIKMKWL